MRYQGHVHTTLLECWLGNHVAQSQPTDYPDVNSDNLAVTGGSGLCAMVGFPPHRTLESYHSGRFHCHRGSLRTRDEILPHALMEEPALAKARDIEVPIVDVAIPNC